MCLTSYTCVTSYYICCEHVESSGFSIHCIVWCEVVTARPMRGDRATAASAMGMGVSEEVDSGEGRDDFDGVNGSE